MRILIADSCYRPFLDAVYAGNDALSRSDYERQWRTLMGRCFGTADFYSANLRLLGHEATELIANCKPLQQQWAREHRLTIPFAMPRMHVARVRGLPVPRPRASQKWVRQVVAAQVKEYQPDVFYVQDLWLFDKAFIDEAVRPYVRLVVGQHAASLPPDRSCAPYDVILSSLPNQVEHFRRLGIKSEYFAIGFEPAVLHRVGQIDQHYDLSYIGGYAGVHRDRIKVLETVAREVPVDCWGYGVEGLAQASPIRCRYHGEAWGLDMYRIRAGSRICITGHSTASGQYANNMSLYEITGMGSLLMTDEKSNLNNLFAVGSEVIAYRDAGDCLEKVRYYLAHEDERAEIARAGQERTLRDHTYHHRMQELATILMRHLQGAIERTHVQV